MPAMIMDRKSGWISGNTADLKRVISNKPWDAHGFFVNNRDLLVYHVWQEKCNGGSQKTEEKIRTFHLWTIWMLQNEWFVNKNKKSGIIF